MDLQFQQTALNYLQTAVREYQSQEQTQEIRIPEGMPDVAVVLACWGQVVLRGKEWRSDQVGVAGGVMAKVLYLPEEVGPPQVLEAWLPFQMKWSIPAGGQDGKMLVIPGLRGADARILSARKLIVRVNIGMQMEALIPAQTDIYKPENPPEDVQFLVNRYPVSLPKEAGEKAFQLDEMLQLPASDPKPEQVIRLNLSPRVMEQKVLSDKLIFRGVCVVHLLYRGVDGQLYSRDLDMPFSQYADLQGEYEPEATVGVIPVITNLEPELTQEGALHLKVGLSGQYVIYDSMNLELVQDAYSPVRTVDPVIGQLMIPAVLDRVNRPVSAQVDPGVDVMRPVDVTFWQEAPYIVRDDDLLEADLGGTFQMLYYDPEGQLQGLQSRWQDSLQTDVCSQCDANVSVQVAGNPHYHNGMLQTDLDAQIAVTAGQGMDMITGTEMGERAEPDPKRPSLVVTKAGTDTLWQIAKSNATTVDRILKANGLTDAPPPDSVLLIPIL